MEGFLLNCNKEFMDKYILAIDAGTTSSRAIIFNKNAEVIEIAQYEFNQFFPKEGWVEHDAVEIWNTQLKAIKDVVNKSKIDPNQIDSIGITNQRETTIIWDKQTGKPVYNAIVWQDRRTASFCDQLIEKNKTSLIQQKTGLVIDAYFSGTKIKWILDNNQELREKVNDNKLLFGTVDTWLIWNLTNGKSHITDPSNASRTLLYNIKDDKWDKDLLDLFDVPENILPNVVDSSSISTNIGVAPHCNTDDKAVPKFKHGTIISSFFLKFKTFIASVKAEDPELTIRAYFFENFLAINFSNLFTE